ncbi:MAG: hypothetical protein JSW08_02740 [archaeon]|nr:MAG: hypothetical protein JSW08_02740 [archaeon]
MVDFDNGCRECGITGEKLFDTLTDGRLTKLCKRCTIANDSMVFEEEESPVHKEGKKTVLRPKPKENFTLNDLYERYWELKKKKKSPGLMKEEEVVEDLETKKVKDLEEIKDAIEDVDIDFNTPETKKMSLKDFLGKVTGRGKEKV